MCIECCDVCGCCDACDVCVCGCCNVCDVCAGIGVRVSRLSVTKRRKRRNWDLTEMASTNLPADEFPLIEQYRTPDTNSESIIHSQRYLL